MMLLYFILGAFVVIYMAFNIISLIKKPKNFEYTEKYTTLDDIIMTLIVSAVSGLIFGALGYALYEIFLVKLF